MRANHLHLVCVRNDNGLASSNKRSRINDNLVSMIWRALTKKEIIFIIDKKTFAIASPVVYMIIVPCLMHLILDNPNNLAKVNNLRKVKQGLVASTILP